MPALTIRLLHDTGVSTVNEYATVPTLTGTGNPDAIVDLFFDGRQTPITVMADDNGNWTYTPGSLPYGTHTVQVSETNVLDTPSLTFTYEPEVKITSVVYNSGIGSIELQGSAPTGLNSPLQVDDSFIGPAIQLGTTMTGPNWSFSGSLPHSPPGTVSVISVAFEVAGVPMLLPGTNWVVIGTMAPEVLTGSGGDDFFFGGGGNDAFDGGPGFDIVAFSSFSSSYVEASYNGEIAVLQAGPDGHDRLFNIEQLHFTDRTIATSAVAAFDALAYIASYPNDLIAAFGTNGQAGFDHYIDYGFSEGRHVTFDGLTYIASYTDLIQAFGANADAGAQHYIQYGYHEGRHATFDALDYIASYPDLIQAFGANIDAGAQHYIQYGFNEGRHATFDTLDYIATYGDLIQKFGMNFAAAEQEYIQVGYFEGRQPSFDGLEYIASYPDLIQAFGANAQAGEQHYIQYGYNEGRSINFDGLDYVASYGDLIKAFGPNATADQGAQHYIQYGHNEGRHISFDAAQYVANYPDLLSAFGSNLMAGEQHFIQYGYYEGRTDQVFTDANGIRKVGVDTPNTFLTATSSSDVFVFLDAPVTGNTAINAFDPTHDAVELSHNLPGFSDPTLAFQKVESDQHNMGHPISTYIAIDPNNSITLLGVPPSQFTPNNIITF
jgi:serralysin